MFRNLEPETRSRILLVLPWPWHRIAINASQQPSCNGCWKTPRRGLSRFMGEGCEQDAHDVCYWKDFADWLGKSWWVANGKLCWSRGQDDTHHGEGPKSSPAERFFLDEFVWPRGNIVCVCFACFFSGCHLDGWWKKESGKLKTLTRWWTSLLRGYCQGMIPMVDEILHSKKRKGDEFHWFSLIFLPMAKYCWQKNSCTT